MPNILGLLFWWLGPSLKPSVLLLFNFKPDISPHVFTSVKKCFADFSSFKIHHHVECYICAKHHVNILQWVLRNTYNLNPGNYLSYRSSKYTSSITVMHYVLWLSPIIWYSIQVLLLPETSYADMHSQTLLRINIKISLLKTIALVRGGGEFRGEKSPISASEWPFWPSNRA